MISLEDAQRLLLDHVACLDHVGKDIENAVGYILADDIRSPINVPSYRNSSMDGFAVHTRHLGSPPTVLNVVQTSFAGSERVDDVNPSGALKIMTGAPVPDAYDAVVALEDTEFDDNRVVINRAVEPGENIRSPGEDLSEGEQMFSRRRKIRQLDIGLLASIGLREIRVIRKPRLLIMSTGDELTQAGKPLKFGHVYDSNSFTIEAMTRQLSSLVETRRSIGDQIDLLTDALQTDHDVIVATGGVSVGDRDYLPLAARKCGWHTLFHNVAVKPGKPVLVATRNKQILFGLPGNPLSGAVTCALLVIPALKKMTGVTQPLPSSEPAILEGPISLSGNRTLAWPGRLRYINGTLHVSLSKKRSSAALSALIDSDGLVLASFNPDGGKPIVRAIPWGEILSA